MNILKEKRGNHLAIKIYIDQGHNPEGINAGAEGLEYESRMSLIKWDVFSMTFYQKMTDLRPASHALRHRPP